MSFTDTQAALMARKRATIRTDESNRERLIRQMGGGNRGAATLISQMSRPLAHSQGGTSVTTAAR